eukprot:scaffold164576_cov30-Tisochrysis_lutea.AAC.1
MAPPAPPPPPPAVLIVERARSGRSRCVSSQDPIALGELRIGLLAWMGGRTTICWQRPQSFLERGASIGYALNSAASCRVSKRKLKKGELRLAVRNGPSSHFYISWDAAVPAVRQALLAAGTGAHALVGIDGLNASDARAVLEACKLSKRDRDEFARQHPHPCEAAPPTAAKKRAGESTPVVQQPVGKKTRTRKAAV